MVTAENDALLARPAPAQLERRIGTNPIQINGDMASTCECAVYAVWFLQKEGGSGMGAHTTPNQEQEQEYSPCTATH